MFVLEQRKTLAELESQVLNLNYRLLAKAIGPAPFPFATVVVLVMT